MAPAFSSTKQAAGFALLLLVLLLLPGAVGKSGLPPREQIYSSLWWASGPYAYLHQQIFEEKGDVDIAFVGASHIWHGIDTPYVQERLSEKLGRPAVVRSLCWSLSGYDALYFITQDLLEHRRVHTLVYYDLYDEEDIPRMPHPLATHWFRVGDNFAALSGLPLRIKSSYYFAAVLGMPRNLLCWISPNAPADLFRLSPGSFLRQENALNPAARLGALTEELGFRSPVGSQRDPFVIYSPRPAAGSSAAAIYSPVTKQEFRFEDFPIPASQLYFAQKFADLARDHGCKLVLLHVPVFNERKSEVIREHLFWPDVLHTEMDMVGIPPAALFRDLRDEDIRKLYGDQAHLNKNGQAYFTPTITPTLVELYAR